MKKTIVILCALLLAYFVNTSAAEYPDFGAGPNGYIILRAEDGTLTNEVRLVGPDFDMCRQETYYGGEEVPDEVTYAGKTYKVVEFGPFDDSYNDYQVHRLKFGKNMRKVRFYPNLRGFYHMADGFEVSEGNKHLKAIDGILYTADGKTLLKCHPYLNSGSSPKRIVIPDGVETIEQFAFISCSFFSIDSLPKSLKEIRQGAFEYSKIVSEEFVVPEGVRVIERDAFSSTSIRKLILPSTIEEYGYQAAMLKLETLVCLAPTPPILNDSFSWLLWANYLDQDIVLMVPAESMKLYQQDPTWGEVFRNIRAYTPTGIESLTGDNMKGGKVYRLDGILAKPTKGIYIQNGRKVMVK